MSKVKDKKKMVINPITGKVDVVAEFNTSKIITHSKNQMGNDIVFFDPNFNIYVPADDMVVTDNEGNVVSL